MAGYYNDFFWRVKIFFKIFYFFNKKRRLMQVDYVNLGVFGLFEIWVYNLRAF